MTETTTFAATIRDNAPGRTESIDSSERTDGLHAQPTAEFARTIRDSAPGRS